MLNATNTADQGCLKCDHIDLSAYVSTGTHLLHQIFSLCTLTVR